MQGPCFRRAFPVRSLTLDAPVPMVRRACDGALGESGRLPWAWGLCLGRPMIGIRATEILAIAGPIAGGAIAGLVRVGKASAR